MQIRPIYYHDVSCGTKDGQGQRLVKCGAYSIALWSSLILWPLIVPLPVKLRLYGIPPLNFSLLHNCTVFCSQSSAVLDPRVGLAAPWMYFFHLYLFSSLSLMIDSATGSSVHVLMLSIQAVRGLLRLRAPGIVPCIISPLHSPGNSLVSSLYCICIYCDFLAVLLLKWHLIGQHVGLL